MDVRAAVQECGAKQQGLATRAQLLAAGVASGSLSRACASSSVSRVRPAVYALAPLLPWPVFVVSHQGVDPAYVQHVRAVLLSLGESVTASGTTAACLRGWGLLHEPVRTVAVAVAHGRSRLRLAGVRSVQRRRPDREAVEVREGEATLWVTTALTTVLDCCREVPLLDATVICDSALRSGQVTMSELRRAAERLRGRRHASRARRALALCDPESGSVLESVLRVLMVQSGLTAFQTQRVLYDARGVRVHRVDFCFEDARLVVETDGARWHPDAARDQKTDNRLVAAGWRVLRLSWADVVHDGRAAIELVRAAVRAGCEDFHMQVPAAA